MTKQEFITEFVAHNCDVTGCRTQYQIGQTINWYIKTAKQTWDMINGSVDTKDNDLSDEEKDAIMQRCFNQVRTEQGHVPLHRDVADSAWHKRYHDTVKQWSEGGKVNYMVNGKPRRCVIDSIEYTENGVVTIELQDCLSPNDKYTCYSVYDITLVYD